MVEQDSGNGRAQRGDPPDERGAGAWMPLHREALLDRELAGLAQHVLGNRELADVVQRRPGGEHAPPLLVPAETDRDRVRELGHACRVPRRIGVAALDRPR